MFQNWVINTGNRTLAAPFSKQDHGDFWPVSAQAKGFGHDGSGGSMTVGGICAGTLVATEMGWLAVQDLRAGDRVVTFDNGMAPVQEVAISRLATHAGRLPRAFWPLRVPTKALGNRQEMLLQPEQAVLLESDAAEALYGDPFVLIHAAALEGYHGIKRVAPPAELQIVSLRFRDDQVIYANGMVLIHCPAGAPRFVQTAGEVTMAGGAGSYRCLPRAQSLQLLRAMQGTQGHDIRSVGA
ncbi:MAG: Hint domain-containing protein [Pararhodobacter sp.]|nr:Hint domain-containing protein [Pararhodobacter sp.]